MSTPQPPAAAPTGEAQSPACARLGMLMERCGGSADGGASGGGPGAEIERKVDSSSFPLCLLTDGE